MLPTDADRLRDGFARLSEESRYRRFMTSLEELTDEQVRYLTDVDHLDHEAWVALDPTDPAEPGLGVARYVRVPGEHTVAEAAITVVDSHQRRGLGTLLLAVLALSAKRNGIDTFRAFVLEENRPMLDLLHQLGARTEYEPGGALRVETPIPRDPEDLPDTPAGRVLKAAARKVLPPFDLWPGTVGRRS